MHLTPNITEERKENRVMCLRAPSLSVFVDTTCGVCCAWAMPVYVSVKVNSGGGKERHLTIHTGTIDSLSL